MYVGPARSGDELKAAQELAARTFLSGDTTERASEQKAFLWNEPGFPGLDHVLVASQGASVSGTIRLLPRALRRSGERFSAVGISSVCVAESERGKGISRRLMLASIEQARGLGYTLVALFARRAVDHMYPRFDIWGIASYSQAHVARPSATEAETACALRPAAAADIAMLARWHLASYADCFGWFDRSEEQWGFLLERARMRHLSIQIVEDDGKPIGYVVRDGHRIVESGIGDVADARQLLEAVMAGRQALVLDMPPRHILASSLIDRDITMTARLCYFGGHMVGVLDRNAICRSLGERVAVRAAALRLPPRDERIDGVRISWDGRGADVTLLRTDRKEFLGLRTTARLVGARLAPVLERSLLAPVEALDFQALDEF